MVELKRKRTPTNFGECYVGDAGAKKALRDNA